MILNTGIGYFVENGKIISKFDLPVGEHPDPRPGLTIVELSTREALDAVEVYIPPLPPEVLEKEAQRASARSKLKALGLTDEEIKAL